MFSRPGEVLLEAGPQLEEPRQLPADRHLARGGLEHAADALEERRLARAVAPEDPDRLALPDRQRHLAQRPEVLGGPALAAVDDALLDRVVLAVGQAEALGDVAHVDREVTHG